MGQGPTPETDEALDKLMVLRAWDGEAIRELMLAIDLPHHRYIAGRPDLASLVTTGPSSSPRPAPSFRRAAPRSTLEVHPFRGAAPPVSTESWSNQKSIAFNSYLICIATLEQSAATLPVRTEQDCR
jgi:hypothetical protein